MKINWGTGVIIAFVAFISFIMYFVIIMGTNDKYNRDLVTEEYYKKELAFQKQINKEQKTRNSNVIPIIIKNKNDLVIQFSEKQNPLEISGTLFFYRPSNKKLDFKIPITLSDTNFIIPKKRLLEGRWNIEIDWSYNGEEYFYKEKITF